MRLREALEKYKKVTPSKDHDCYFTKVSGSYICIKKDLEIEMTPGITIDTIIDCEEKESWQQYK